MTAVWARWRTELRWRWRTWLRLGILVGAFAGAVLAIVAGARRTDSAYPRFLREQRAYDVLVVNYPEDGTAVFDFEEVARLPQVANSAWGSFEYVSLGIGTGAIASVDGRIGTEINRFKMLEGRRARPDQPNEVVVSFDQARRHGLKVGTKIPIVAPKYTDAMRHILTGETERISPEIRAEFETFSPQDLAELEHLLHVVPDGNFLVVGIEASPGEFPPQFAGNLPSIHATPAAHRLGLLGGDRQVLMVRLKRGDTDLAAFLHELERRADGKPLQVAMQRDHAAAVERSIGHHAVALWILAGLTALVGGMVVGQLLGRQTFLESGDHLTLRALGMSRGQLFALGMAGTVVVAGIGAAVGLALAGLLSPLFPAGLARVAELDPGFTVDAKVLMIGAAAVVLAVSALGALPAWRGARRYAAMGNVADPGSGARPSRVVRLVARAGLPVPVVVGTQMALERGRGRSAVPVITGVMATTLGITVMVSALTFWSSLLHLRATPRLYGLTWTMEVTNFGYGPRLAEAGPPLLGVNRAVDAFGVGWADNSLVLNGQQLDVVALDQKKGQILPPILEGRAPSSRDEIVLGTRTLKRLEIGVGDHLEARVPGVEGSRRMQVVGRGVLPAVSSGARLGDGGLVTVAGLRTFYPELDLGDGALFIRLAAGAKPDDIKAELEEHLGELFVLARGEPTDLVNFGGIQALPLAVGAILAVLAAASLVHVLITAVRRRGRDVAVLKALGFTRRQVRLAVHSQATTFVAIATVFGLPLGLAAGRWAWTLFATELGVVVDLVLALPLIGLVVAAAVVLANLVAALAAAAASHRPPALALRVQ